MHLMYVIWLLKVISIIKTSLNLFKITSFSLDKLIYITDGHQSKIIITFFLCLTMQSVNKLWMQFKYPTRYRPYNMKGLQYSCIQVIGKKQEPLIYHDWKPKENLGSRWRVRYTEQTPWMLNLRDQSPNLDHLLLGSATWQVLF